jgi:hypothetical protein
LENRRYLAAPYLVDWWGNAGWEDDFAEEGTQYNLYLRFIDDDGDSISAEMNWGDESTTELYQGIGSGEAELYLIHVYPEGPDQRTLTISYWTDDGSDIYSNTIPIVNVAPFAAITKQVTDNGQTVTASLNASDRSSVDNAAGLHYSFATTTGGLATSYAGATDPSSKSFSFESPGTHTIWGRVFDKDGGWRQYNTSVVQPDLAVETVSSSAINLSWQDNITGEIAWRIQWSTDGGQTFNYFEDQPASSGTSSGPMPRTYLATGLEDGTRYHFRVRAVGASGTASETIYSPKRGETTDLPAPTALSATQVSDIEVRLAWIDAAENSSGFVIERADSAAGPEFTDVATIALGFPEVTSWSDYTIQNGHTYTYRVKAISEDAQSAVSNQSSVAFTGTGAGNDAIWNSNPIHLTVRQTKLVPSSSARMQWEWTDQIDAEIVYDLERSVDGGSWARFPNLGPTVRQYAANELRGKTIAFRVGALSVQGHRWSNVVVLNAAASITSATVDSSKMDVSWSFHETANPARIFVQAATLDELDPNDNKDDEEFFTTVAELPGSARATQIKDLVDGETYVFRIVAEDDAGNSAFNDSPHTFQQPARATIPLAPVNLSAQLVNAYNVNLTWEDRSLGNAGYVIRTFNEQDDFLWEQRIAGGGLTQYSILIQGVGPGTTLKYEVAAYAAGPINEENLRDSAPSNRVAVTYPSNPTYPERSVWLSTTGGIAQETDTPPPDSPLELVLHRGSFFGDPPPPEQTVNLIATGTAEYGVDYTLSTGLSATFGVGVTAVPIVVNVIEDLLIEGTEWFTIQVAATGQIDATTSPSTTRSIADNGPQITSVQWMTWGPSLDPTSPPASNEPWTPNKALDTDLFPPHRHRSEAPVRIFPDKQKPYDTANNLERDPFAADRKKVIIEAQASPARQGVPIYFAVFDIDSPEASSLVDKNDEIDEANNTMILRGDDNRPLGDGYEKNLSAITNAQGIARVTFEVSMQPGNNFRAVATTKLQDRNGLAHTDVDAIKPVYPRGMRFTKPLLVWRYLHIEQDSMAKWPANEVFTPESPAPELDPSGARLKDLDVSVLTSHFRRAYIEARLDVIQLGLNPRRATAWHRLLRNVPVPGDPTMDDLAQSVRDVVAEDNFWVFQTLTGYTGKVTGVIGNQLVTKDVQGAQRDPLSAAWYFVEYARQSWQNAPQGKVDIDTSFQRLVYHEAVHAFEINHPPAGHDGAHPGEQGIMDEMKQFMGTDKSIELTPRQLDIMLNVVRPK